MSMIVHITLCVTICMTLCVTLTAAQAADNASVEKPRVVSINLCTDQWALTLADSEQIQSLSFLAQDADGAELWQEAKAFPINRGQSEEILRLQPDLVLAGETVSPYTLKLLQEVGLKVVQIPIARTVSEVLETLLHMGEVLQQQSKARHLHTALHNRLENLPRAGGNAPRMLVYDPNGYTAGSKSLRGDMLRLAGWRNVAAERGIDTYGVLPLESIISLQPDAVWTSPYRGDTWSRGQAINQHPALYLRGLQPLSVVVPARRTLCGGPWTIDVVEHLAQQRTKLQSRQ